MKRHRNASPVWMAARFASACACRQAIRRGDRILYHPASRTAQCQTCGKEHQRNLAADDFDLAVHDNSRMGGYANETAV
jgi:hypothetical protein